MSIKIIRMTAEHAPRFPDLGRICFEAFAALHDRHNVERDFDSPDVATMMITMFGTRPDFAGFLAVDSTDGRLLGSNFLGFPDGVAGVGPITVTPEAQSRGVGRLLMLAVMDEAKQRGIAQVRLLQEAINTTSLSLYTKLGFDWREAVAIMRPVPAPIDDPRIRPLTPDDLPAVGEISARHYHSSRREEVAGLFRIQLPGFGLVKDGRLTGYSFPGFLGHGFAQSGEDLADLVAHSARHVPPHFLKYLVPLAEHALHRALMARGAKAIKLMNYMTTGEYRRPSSAWMPCIGM